ncbi:MAG: hypothetical protein AAFV95_19230 [Bacteroidota bacterium]
MINIQNAVRIPYNGGANFMTVYFDFADDSIMYAVPVPRIAMDANGNPSMSVTKYQTTNEGSYGYLNMDVEVEVPTAAREAAETAYPDKSWGQFQWLATECFLSFVLPSEPDGSMVQGQPSLYGTNRANFQLQLASEADLNAVIGSFKDQPVSSFQMEYDMTTLTMLNDVTATVSFDAAIAIEFETLYEKQKDTWGNTKEVAAGVKKNLQVSKAGDVEITWGTTNPSPEFEARVNEWAWTTLEKAVTDAIEVAQAAATSEDPIESLDSFEQTYTENSVVEWNIVSSSPLAGFTADQWNNIYREVDNRELVVNFALKGELVNDEGLPVCQEVKVTVKYPTRTTDNTFTLHPTEEGRTLHTYEAEGDTSGGSYNPEYEYQYTVYYSDTDTYVSPWTTTTETEVNIIPNQLGAKKIRFVGSNIPFGTEPSQVKKVRIDFFFERPNGEENVTQLAELTANGGDGAIFESYFNVAIENSYSYRFIYELNDGTVRVMNTISDFGKPNSNLFMVQALIKEQIFTLQVKRQKNPDYSVDYVYLDVIYEDQQNNERLTHTFDWEVDWSGSSRPTASQTWKFPAINNGTGANYEFNGDYSDSDWDTIDIQQVVQQAKSTKFSIDPGYAYYGIKISPANIDWSVVSQVYLSIFQQSSDENTFSFTEASDILEQRDRSEIANLGAGIYNIDNTVSFIQPAEGVEDVDRCYAAWKAKDDANVTFFYNATYVQKDGSAARDSGDIEVTNRSVIVLPDNGPANSSPMIHHVEIEKPTAHTKSRRDKKKGRKKKAVAK